MNSKTIANRNLKFYKQFSCLINEETENDFQKDIVLLGDRVD